MTCSRSGALGVLEKHEKPLHYSYFQNARVPVFKIIIFHIFPLLIIIKYTEYTKPISLHKLISCGSGK